MRVSTSRLAAAATLSILLAGPAPAQDDLGRVKVQLPFPASLGVSGEPVAGLGLRLTDLESGRTVEIASARDGSFAFDDLESGPYRLHLTPPARGSLETVSVALLRAFLPPGSRARPGKVKVKEIVVVGVAAPTAPGARAPRVHTPEWTDFQDSDPGVAEGGEGHEEWIELVSLNVSRNGKSLLLTIPPEAWRIAAGDAFFDIFVGADRSERRGRRALRSPPPCPTCEAGEMKGGVVFGDGISGARPPSRAPGGGR
ncbi:MAG: carboxypeptidase-like regulatory domain-containing protein [Gemmatimonadota bacterium]|nr:carboxypeptidase-like regulatory domain-containing protein [Gemmatimonadota bacterium]